MENAHAQFIELCEMDPGLLEDLKVSFSQIPIFEKLDPSQIEDLIAIAEPFIFEPGELIFEQDSQGDSLFVVLEGRVRLTFRDPEGVSRLVDEKERGESFGEISFLTGTPRSLSAINGDKESFLLLVPSRAFVDLLEHRPRIGYTVYANLVRSIQERLDPLPLFFRNLVLWGYRPPSHANAGAVKDSGSGISMAVMLAFAGMLTGLIQFYLVRFILKTAAPELVAQITWFREALLLGLMALAGAVGAFLVGVHYETLQRAMVYRQSHPRCCATCKFVLYDPTTGRHGCTFASHPELRTQHRLGLRQDTFTDCPSFEEAGLSMRVKARTRDRMARD